MDSANRRSRSPSETPVRTNRRRTSFSIKVHGSGRDPAPVGPTSDRRRRRSCLLAVKKKSIPQAGEHSVSAARQYLRCATQVRQQPGGGHLVLEPRRNELSDQLAIVSAEDWIKCTASRRQARIPDNAVHRTKQSLALDLIVRAQDLSLPARAVLATRPTATILIFAGSCVMR